MQTMVRVLLFIILTFVTSSSLSANTDICFGADSIGYYIEDLSTGEIITSKNSEMPFIPASVTKIITTSSLLRTQNPLKSFQTTVLLDGTTVDTVFHGNVTINASGDATLDSRFFEQNIGFVDSVITRLLARDIKIIEGRVLINTPEYFTCSAPDGWMEEDFVWPYGAVHHGLNYADNEYTLELPNLTCSPEVPGLMITRTKKRGGSKYFMPRNSQHVTLNRNAPKRGRIILANPNPEGTLSHLIETKCRQSGIDICNKNISISGNYTPDTLYCHNSPFYRDIINVTLKRSHNLMAESLLHASFPGCTGNDAIKQEFDLWQKSGIEPNNCYLEDGSGLSRNNRLTPVFLADILRYMADSNYADLFINSLPVSSVSGTMRKFTDKSHLYGRLALKTGSMRRVRCYAGYYLNEFGNPTHIVVVMLNGVKSSSETIKLQVAKFILSNLY